MRKTNVLLAAVLVFTACLAVSGRTPPPPGYEKAQKEKNRLPL